MEQDYKQNVRYDGNRVLDEKSLLEVSSVVENAPYLFGQREPYLVMGGSFGTRCVHRKPSVATSDKKTLEATL